MIVTNDKLMMMVMMIYNKDKLRSDSWVADWLQRCVVASDNDDDDIDVNVGNDGDDDDDDDDDDNDTVICWCLFFCW